jgi:hypothetical protein
MPSDNVTKRLCFVIGPIGEDNSEARIHADWLFEGIVLPVMLKFPGFTVKRADKDHRPGLIHTQMIDDLLDADLVIADLSYSNPNAFYEIGIRHMAQKPIIHMQLATQTIPFDNATFRTIKFSRTQVGELGAARNELRKFVQEVLAPNYKAENPVTATRLRTEFAEQASELKTLQIRLNEIEQLLTTERNAPQPSRNLNLFNDLEKLLKAPPDAVRSHSNATPRQHE